MFYIGKEYADKSGKKHKVLMHNWKGRFPIITVDEKSVMGKFTRDGHFYEHKESEFDLIAGE